ncbi:MFS transporter [Caldimonas aquatica]|uniref:MFS transporter n=1 Tax=Caldimonas aquatica TaxID=376175 RepID=A0ABY6MTB6_9BURK|nr:MFS transporter [Schlegelella aquatica]UZD55268.1 MFS transporter [Schlegelella aquatica]
MSPGDGPGAVAGGAVRAAASSPAAGGGQRPWRLRDGLSYGALGLPLAFVALPLYVVWPAHYAATQAVSLAALGAVLLAARLFDAVIDPWIGRAADALFARSPGHAWRAAALAAGGLAGGFVGLFFPPQGLGAGTGTGPVVWAAAMLVPTYACYSLVSVVHQAWGARWGGDAPLRARIVAWRESAALAGVLLASVTPALWGLPAMAATFIVALALGLAALAAAPVAPGVASAAAGTRSPAGTAPPSLREPWRVRDFRALIAVFVVNGIASAVPATLFLFFVRDRLTAGAWEGAFLAAYFAAAAVSMPLWLAAVRRLGLARSWLAGMLLAVVTFAGAAALGPGDVLPFLAVCVASGLALGADLAVPAAMLTSVVRSHGHGGRAEGAYFGWWNFASKLNLALAAGVALPALSLWGYAPGSREPQALAALTLAYCVLPCALKLLAAASLYALWIRPLRSGADR